MKWNNGRERAEFEREQKKLRARYARVGMTESQIASMYDFDKRTFNGNRREAEHTQSMCFSAFADGASDDGQTPLYKRFYSELTVELDVCAAARFSWIEEISDDGMARALKSLSRERLEILTMLVIDGMTQAEIARAKGVSQQYISQIAIKIKKILGEALVKKAVSSATT